MGVVGWGGQRERRREEKDQGFFKGTLSVTYFLQLGSIFKDYSASGWWPRLGSKLFACEPSDDVPDPDYSFQKKKKTVNSRTEEFPDW